MAFKTRLFEFINNFTLDNSMLKLKNHLEIVFVDKIME